MLFNSLQFLLFFAFVISLYYALPHRPRWVLLLFASCYFYMVFIPEYILILFGVILIDYASAFLIEKNQGKQRKLFLALSLVTNIGILVYFKYYNFFLDSSNAVLHPFHLKSSLKHLEIILPIGLSFHTFQAMSYTLEVYRGNQKPEKHLGIYAVYVLFFPQLVAGPIERPQNLLHQFKREIIFSRANLRSGLLLMAWGFFKKVVIADRLAEVVDQCYADVPGQSAGSMWLGVVFYSIQIYCDFSGYSDIAIGAAKTMGINLMENFRNPYLSTSVTEFWKRWHISLSSWFRDYVYIPLGGSRVATVKFCRNILIVFLLSGLWHGANYTFIIWGLIHAVFILIEYFILRKRKQVHSFLLLTLRTIYVFFVTTLAWVFFRSADLKQAMSILKKLFSFGNETFTTSMVPAEVIFSFVLIILLLAGEKRIKTFAVEKNRKYYATLITLVVVCYIFGIFNYKQFIYFQF